MTDGQGLAPGAERWHQRSAQVDFAGLRPRGAYPDVSEALRNALTKNPFMGVSVTEG